MLPCIPKNEFEIYSISNKKFTMASLTFEQAEFNERKRRYMENCRERANLTRGYFEHIPIDLVLGAPDLDAHHNPNYIPPEFYQIESLNKIKEIRAKLLLQDQSLIVQPSDK